MDAAIRKSAEILAKLNNGFASARNKQHSVATMFEHAVCIQMDLLHWSFVPMEWKDSVKLTCMDVGIDAMSKDLSTAYQIKYRQAGSSISWKELSTFHTATCVAGIKKRVLVRNKESSITSKTIKEGALEKLDITDLPICMGSCLNGAMERKEDSASVAVEQKAETRLRDYQAEALQRCLSSFDDNVESHDGRFLLRMPCGSGKTLLIGEIVNERQEYRICIFVQSLLLLEQTASVIERHGIAVRKVGTGYSSGRWTEEDMVVCCVYNSVRKIAQEYFDLIIIDEAHHVLLPEIYDEQVADESFAAAINSMDGFKLFMSASLDRADYDVSLRTLIDKKYLTDYVVVVPVAKTEAGEPKRDPNEGLLALLIDHPEMDGVLTYFNRCADAKAFADSANHCGISTRYFDSGTKMGERMQIIRDFEDNKLRMLSTVGVLREGVDFKRANTCMFAEQKASPTEIVQCVGRVLRLHANKPLAYVVLPCYDADEASMSKKIFRALCSVDTSLARKKFSETSRILFADVTFNDTKYIDPTAPDWVDTFDSMERQILYGHWDKRYEELKDHLATHNGKLPGMGERGLGVWCAHQRESEKAGTLFTDRRVRLEALKGWTWGFAQKDWDDWFAEMIAYHEEHNELPKHRKGTKAEIQLASWICRQRTHYKTFMAGAPSQMTAEHASALETVPFWEWVAQKGPRGPR